MGHSSREQAVSLCSWPLAEPRSRGEGSRAVRRAQILWCRWWRCWKCWQRLCDGRPGRMCSVLSNDICWFFKVAWAAVQSELSILCLTPFKCHHWVVNAQEKKALLWLWYLYVCESFCNLTMCVKAFVMRLTLLDYHNGLRSVIG